ncbi:DHA2 family efflux MFS transporter permease subunit [Spirosoma taeanense]|uniref:DHA2 family efflux MFS transporter permease subunit n=1 Tax=Spirosoma taeanense TaxID=2735870 RepID=A0A6M5Y6V0_9BACT|nr:DHA2 family efflux MFS transporter permease subunit [Spirosoma taeanense]QJW88432.1 DHA2 family efflux MFS transporter permease subunit [Spirosoma taeanense]
MATQTMSPPAPPMGLRRWAVVVTAISAAIIELIDTSIVNVGLTDIAGNLGVTIEDVAWVVTSYAIANVIVIPMTGFLQRYFGRKNYYIGSIILFTVASYGCGLSDSLWMLILFRFLQGVGGGALLSTSQGLMFDAFPPAQRPVASALFGMGIVLGPTLGPTLGGYIIDNYHWSWMFYINVPIGILAVFMSSTFIDKKEDEININRRAIHIDQIGILLLAVGIGSLQYVLERGEADDWFDSKTILWLSVAAIIAIPLFVWWELRGTREPVVDLRTLKNRNLTIGSILIVVVGYGLFTSVLLFPLFAQRIVGLTATKTGQLLIPGGLVTLPMFAIVGRMLAKGVSPRLIVALGYVAFGSFCFMMSTYNADASSGDFIQALIIRGIGLALVNVPLINQSVSTLEPRQLPTGIAIVNMMRQIGGAFGVAITNTYVTQRTAVHRSDLVSNLQPGDMITTERITALTQGLVARGMNAFDAVSGAYKTLDAIISRQALMLAYLDTFQLAGMFFVVTSPLLLLLKRKKVDAATAKAIADAAH